MDIHVFSLAATEVASFQLLRGTSVLEVKQRLAELVGVGPCAQQLVYCQTILRDSELLEEAGVPDGAHITLVLRRLLVVTSSSDGSAVLWHAETGRCLQAYPHQSAVCQASFSSDASQVLTISQDGAQLWSTDSDGPQEDGPLQTFGVGRLLSGAFSLEAGVVLTHSSAGQAQIWEIATGQCLHSWAHAGNSGLRSAMPQLSPDGTMVLLATSDCMLRIFSASSGKALQNLAGHCDIIFHARFSIDSKMLVTASQDWPHQDCCIKVWDLSAGHNQCIQTFDKPDAGIFMVELSPDNTAVLTVSRRAGAKLWNIASGEFVRSFQGHADQVRMAAFSPDGTMLATASNDRSAKIWSTSRDECLQTLSGHTGPVFAVSFSCDKEWVLTISADVSVKLWNARSGVCHQTLVGHTAPVATTVFSQ